MLTFLHPGFVVEVRVVAAVEDRRHTNAGFDQPARQQGSLSHRGVPVCVPQFLALLGEC